MPNRKLTALASLMALVLWSCAERGPFPPPVPSPIRDWAVVLVQSGGFAGVSLEVRVDSSGAITAKNLRRGLEITRPLPASDLQALDGMLTDVRLQSRGDARSTCADCFVYDLEVMSLGEKTLWHGDDTTLEASGVAELIRLLGELRDEALSFAT